MKTQQEYLMEVITKDLVGKRITSLIKSPDGEHVGFLLSDDKVVWVECDPEGNGVGWLNVDK